MADTYIHFKSSLINKYKDLYVLMITHMHIYAFIFLQVFGISGKRDPYGFLASHGCHTILLTILTNIDHSYKIRGPDRGSVPVQDIIASYISKICLKGYGVVIFT